LNHIYYNYLKSFLVSIFISNKKEQFSLLKLTSNLIENFEEEFYEAEKKPENYIIEKDYNFSSLKFKVNSTLGIIYQQYGYLLDAQKSFENSLRINPLFLKTNKNLLMEYLLISDILLEQIYNYFKLNRLKYDLCKKNFDLAHYITNEKEKEKKMQNYMENITNLISHSSEVFNFVNLLNQKSVKFSYYKNKQENFVLSLINYCLENKNDYNTASVFKEYWNTLYEIDTNQEENYINSINIFNFYKINSNKTNRNHQDILDNLISIRDSLSIEEFMIEENTKLEKINLDKENIYDNYNPDKFKEIRENKDLYENWINFGIAVYYNILINEIKCNQHNSAIEKINFLLNFINKKNQNKTIGSVIDHPYLLINLNLLSVHYHLIKNQKIYSVPYLRAINSMLVKYDWGENTKINSYLKEMVELVKTI
jgi:hypothetical protein